MTGFSPDSAWRSAVMAAEAARIADQLANARTGRLIDLPGVIGLLDVPGFVYVNELLGSAESLASHLMSIRPAGFVFGRGRSARRASRGARRDGMVLSPDVGDDDPATRMCAAKPA